MRPRLRGAVLELGVGANVLRAEAEQKDGSHWKAEASYGSPHELTTITTELIRACPVSCHSVRIVLNRPPVQFRTLTDVPPVGDRELVELVSNHAHRFFRKNGGRLLAGAAWTNHDGRRVAQAAAIAEELVEGIINGVRAQHLSVAAVCVADAEPSLTLMPLSEQAKTTRAIERRLRHLTVTAAAAWGMTALVFVARLQWERRATDRELVRLGPPLAALVEARREIREVQAALAAIDQSDAARVRPLLALAALTAALPDSALLGTLSWTAGGATVISGRAPHAAVVLSRMRSIRMLGEPAFDGSISRETMGASDFERFTITFRRPSGDTAARKS